MKYIKHNALESILIIWLLFFINNFSFSQNKQQRDKLLEIDSLIVEKEFDSALIKIENLENYSSFIAEKINRMKLDLKKAKVFYGLKREEESINILLTNFSLLEDGGKYGNLYGDYANYLGKIFQSAKNFDRSQHYFKKGLKYFSSKKDSLNIIKSNFFLAKSFSEEENIDSARFYFENVVKPSIDSNNEDYISQAYSSLSGIAVISDDYQKAKEYGEKSLSIERLQGDKLGEARALFNLSGIYYRKGEFEKARNFYKESFESVKNTKNTDAFRIKENALYNLSYVNEELGDFKSAYFYLLDATELSDSLAQGTINKNISEIAAKYNFEKQARIAQEEKQKTERAEFQRKITFFASAFILLTLLVLSYIFYRNYRLKQQNKLEQVENESQTKIINATVDAKEKERKAIAETLHDSVSALLSSANLHLQATKAQLKEKSPQEITKAQTIVNEASVKIRDLSHELISSVLLKFGLAFAVHDMCQKYSNSEISLHSDDDGIKRYDQDFEIKIHNIIEELVNNILKHSKASNATIMLAHRNNDMLSVRISDDGIGFNPKAVKGKDGLGLSHIGARIKVMKGVFNIISSKENGTNIFISVPIKLKEQIA